ncbi:hypothetical protein BASA81_003756 [Batrachochytrium salamandrivorans]|nr:hypothetical protein BASA81_003756 [Batrachochytrium salamandrivorans]
MWLELVLLVAGAFAFPKTEEQCSQPPAVATQVLEFTSCLEFQQAFWNRKPGIFRGSRNLTRLDSFQQATTRKHMSTLDDLYIPLSTSVSYTGRVYKQSSVAEYVTQYLDHQSEQLGNETFYLFGSHAGVNWQQFLNGYPNLETHEVIECLQLRPTNSAQSFGCAGKNTGVPWHFHGSGFLQQIWGEKQWFLVPPSITNEQIGFDPNGTTFTWWRNQTQFPPLLQTTVLLPGDFIYFPPMWKHATLNLGEWNVWMSTFL